MSKWGSSTRKTNVASLMFITDLTPNDYNKCKTHTIERDLDGNSHNVI